MLLSKDATATMPFIRDFADLTHFLTSEGQLPQRKDARNSHKLLVVYLNANSEVVHRAYKYHDWDIYPTVDVVDIIYTAQKHRAKGVILVNLLPLPEQKCDRNLRLQMMTPSKETIAALLEVRWKLYSQGIFLQDVVNYATEARDILFSYQQNWLIEIM